MRYIARTVSWDMVRLANVERYRKEIPNLEVVVDTQRSCYKSLFKTSDLMNETGAVIIEDDVQLCKNFCARIEPIIAEKGLDKIVSFFERPRVPLETEYAAGSGFLWTQCVYFPPGILGKLKQYFDEYKIVAPDQVKGQHFDTYISWILQKEHIRYWRIRPCYVQHLDFTSAIRDGRSTKRQTVYFVDDLEKEASDAKA